MTHAQRGARVPRATTRRKIWLLCFASVLGTGVLAAASIAQARITQITILTSGTAFGGFSFPVVGQYEFITGIATGETGLFSSSESRRPDDMRRRASTSKLLCRAH